MISDIESKINELIQLETEYGHSYFVYGLSDPGEYCEKYQLLVSLTEKLEQTDPAKGLDDDGEFLLEMISSHICSPEAIAFILINHLPESRIASRIIETHLKSASGSDYYIFAGYYYKNRMKMLENRSSLLIDLMRFNINCNEVINSAYINRFSKDSSISGHYFSGKGAVYTVITGGYDTLEDPGVINKSWDYICFTDQPEKYTSNVWKITPLKEIKDTPVLTQRYAKIFSHKILEDYDYTIYIDGKISINGDLCDIINAYSRGSSMLCFPHPGWQTLREEAGNIVKLKKADSQKVLKQIESYEARGYNNDRPLIETACLFRSHHDPTLQSTMEDWWNEIVAHTTRDQLSLGFVCCKNHFQFDLCGINLYKNNYLSVKDHL